MRSTHEWADALTLQQLRAVVAVAGTGSFGAAATVVGTTQPSVSRAVAAVEAVLGVELFDRTTRRVHLRPAAEEFVERAERILADVQTAAESARTTASAGRRLSVSCLMSVACAHLAPTLVRLGGSAPSLRVSCTEAMQSQVEADVVHGRADIAVADVTAMSTGLRGRALWTEPLHLCVPGSHPLAGAPSVRLTDVDPTDLIAFPRQARLRLDVDRALAGRHGVRAPRIVVQQYATAFQLVERGLGWMVVPACMTPFAPPSTSTPRIADRGLGRTIGAVWRTGTVPSPAADEFVDALAAVADGDA